MKPYYILIILALLFSSCDDEKTIFVADHLGNCEEACLLVRESANDEWANFSNNIEGFDYEVGYEYQLKVKIEQDKTDSNLEYTLLEIVSKTKTAQKSTPNLHNTNWIVTQIAGFENKTDKFPNFTIDNGQINGNSGCNSFGGSIALSNAKQFEVGMLRMTKMYCEAYMPLEKAFTAALSKAKTFELSGNAIQVLDENANLVFEATPEKKETTLNNKWFITTLKGFNNKTGQVPYFTIANGEINGNNGCNNFGGTLETDESGLFKTDMQYVTKKYCTEYAALEKAFQKAIGDVTSYKITDDTLFLLDKSNYVIIAARIENTLDVATSYTPYIIEYNTYSRELAIRNKVVEDKNVLYFYDLRPEKKEEQKVLLSKSELLFFKKQLTGIDMKEIENIVPPSTEHKNDAAVGATLIVSFEGKSYRVPTFDHGNPPESIKKIVDKIMELRSK